jgi:hypothetical protein
MSLTELWPAVQALTAEDKFRLMEWLAKEMQVADALPGVVPGQLYPIWTPYGQDAAAHALMEMLENCDKGART